MAAMQASEKAETGLPFFVQCIIKQLLDSVFVISRIIKVSVMVMSLSLWLRLIPPTSTLIILDITKSHPIFIVYYQPSGIIKMKNWW